MRIRKSIGSIIAFAAIVAVAGTIISMRRASPVAERDAPLPVRSGSSSITPPTAAFVDITRQAGITFEHENGADGQKLLPETMGGGVAFCDVDNDGRPDLLFVDSRPWPSAAANRGGGRSRLVLYRNLGGGRFLDVTAGSGLAADIYGMGVTAADYDNDGWIDLFVTAVGVNHLFRNVGGHFTEVTAAAGVVAALHSDGAASHGPGRPVCLRS